MTSLDRELHRLVERSRAIVRSSSSSLTFGLAGFRIRLVSAGPEMLAYMRPALAHLPQLEDNGTADLTVWMWNTAVTGEHIPELPLPPMEEHAVGVLSTDDLVLAYQSGLRSLSLLQQSTDEAFLIAESVGALPGWTRPEPFRNLLAWWLSGRGLLLAHSAAVSTDDGAVLLVGPSGSGKSSTALACLAAGMGYLGDDYVVVNPQTRDVWSVYTSAKLVVEHHERYPHLMTPDLTNHGEPGVPKRIGWPALEFPDRVVLRSVARSLVLPVVTRGPECSLHAVASSRALMALAPTSMFQSAALRPRIFTLSATVSRLFSPYRLELGDGAHRVPDMLAALIASSQGAR